MIGDRPEVSSFQSRAVTTDLTYLRFHHGTRGRRGNYSPTELDEWARWIGSVRPQVAVWAYFNNDWEGFAPANASALRERLT